MWLRGMTMVVLLSLGLWLTALTPLVGSQEKAESTKPAAGEEVTTFHQLHIDDFGLDCSDCHAAADDAAPDEALRLAARPNHDTCSDCHDEIGESDFTSFCSTCHLDGTKKLGAFPTGQGSLETFSHVMHVDPKGRANSQGIRQDCVFCHQRSTTHRLPQGPTHAQCGSCHSSESSIEPIIDPDGDSETCIACHVLSKVDAPMMARIAGQTGNSLGTHQALSPHATAQVVGEWATVKGVPYRDIVPFRHDRHVQRRDGVAIDCTTCHSAVLHRQGLDQHAPVPAMKECATCHNNASWVRQAFLTKQCKTCHEVVRADMRPQLIDPVSKQLAHTESFRRFHKHMAKSPDRTCQYCHQESVNAQVDNCAGCHSGMAPRSHQALRFSETGHGRHAAMDRTTCATCHTSSFCVSCHQVPPRNHTPLATFRAGAHRHAASLNPRSCLTCHQFEPTCAECHSQSLQR